MPRLFSNDPVQWIQQQHHLFQVKYQIGFKTIMVIFKWLHGKSPNYVQWLSNQQAGVPRYPIKHVSRRPSFKYDTCGKCAFPVCASAKGSKVMGRNFILVLWKTPISNESDRYGADEIYNIPGKLDQYHGFLCPDFRFARALFAMALVV